MKKLFPYILLSIIFIIQIFDKNDDLFIVQIILVIVIIAYAIYFGYIKKLDKSDTI